LIAFDNLLEAVCNVATVFFAMTYIVLFVYFNNSSNETILELN
jgi:hypothetical protein